MKNYCNDFSNKRSITSYVKEYLFTLVLAIVFTFVLVLPFGYKYFVVNGWSSEPYIKYRSLILVKPVKLEDIQAGDYITQKLTNTYLTHRVVEVRDGKIITQQTATGDNTESPISIESVVGKVIIDFRFFSYIYFYFLEIGAGILLCVSLYQAVKPRKREYEA